jgi:ribosome-binding factor A
VPEIQFFLDESLDEVFRIEQLLKEVRKNDSEEA